MKKPQQYIIVDDDRTNNLICEYAVKGYDPQAEIMTFIEPRLALSTIKKEILNGDGAGSPILFVDVNMPSMSGWEFLKELEKLDDVINEKFTIFILSSSIEDFTNERTDFPYVADFLSKPLSKARLQQLDL